MYVLEKNEIYNILKYKKFYKDKNNLLNYLNFTKNNFLNFTKNIKNNQNLLLWQMGHVVFFYSNLILKNLNNCNNIDHIKKYTELNEFYDSYKTKAEYRNNINLLLQFDICILYYRFIIKTLENYIKNNEITNIESYLIMLGILHNEMHNESFIFNQLNISNIINFNTDYIEKEDLIDEIQFINYNNDLFLQGSNDNSNNSNYLIFDNEMPTFIKKINKFAVSKYPITEYQFLQFIKNNGYKKLEYWSTNGKKWLNENNIVLPLYWCKENDNYYKIINNKKYSIITNLPIINISYYEVEAYCKWKNLRLLTESEYEYISTNQGKTLFPWGDNPIKNELCNLNYNKFITSVKDYNKGNNFKGVSQLIGNIWEWCSEDIYPYDGFKIDPVYREMSYPFFGFKKICKGGCFAVPDFLIHPKYRNAQYPDCREQFIGFRVCKNL